MEMDHRRGGGNNRLTKKQSGGSSGFAANSKKGGTLKKKKLGLVVDDGKLKIGFSHSNLENEVSSMKKKKSKLLKKKLKDSNGVDHASVPRKLRSAMKKRNLESVAKLSSDSKRLKRSKTGIECFNKENQEMEEAKAMIVHESISKDEKEVAETLYGLAGMFTTDHSIDNKTTSDPLSNDKETTKVVVDSILLVEATESLEPAVSVLSSANINPIDEMPLEKSDKHPSSTGMVDFLDRLRQSSSVNVTNEPAREIETMVATCHTDYKNNGLALWPGLSGSHVLSKPSSTKLPPWMDQAVSRSKNASLLKEPLRIHPRKLKKCASHIYISRLIKVLQTSKSSTLIESEMSERVLPDPMTTVSDFKNMISPSKRYQNPHLLDINRKQEDMTQLALELYNPQTSQKQGFGFLSLSSTGPSQSHFPLPNSIPRYHHISTAYNSHQVQPYLASRFQTAYNANQQQQQQLQKRLWAAQFRPQPSGNTAPSSNQYSSKPNLSLNRTSIQPVQVASSTRYNNNVYKQQHRLMAAAAAMSMSHHHHHHHHNNNPSRTVMNRQEHHFPLIYEDTRTPLQLLCNEQA